MEKLLIILFIIILVSGLSLTYIIYYNKLNHYKIRIEVAENNIDNYLRKKYDLLCELNVDIKKVTKDDYLEEYIEYKKRKLTNYETDRKLIEGFNVIKEIVLDHKELDNKDFNKKYDKLKHIEEELMSAKNYFNKNITSLNTLIRKFPSNIVAKNHRFKIKPYFDNKNMQDAVIDDFKL